MSERIKIGLGSSKKVPTEQNSTLVHLFLKSKSYRNQCIVSYFLCISIVSGLESRGLSKLFIVNAKGLLKLILHFFLTYSYFLRSFLVFYRTIYNSHICSLYYSPVHFTIPCTQWRHLCADCPHSDHPHTSPMDPNFKFLCSTSSSPLQSH